MERSIKELEKRATARINSAEKQISKHLARVEKALANVSSEQKTKYIAGGAAGLVFSVAAVITIFKLVAKKKAETEEAERKAEARAKRRAKKKAEAKATAA